MTLNEVIETLKRFPKDFVFERGFECPHSYRGYYDQLAFEPAENVRLGLMLDLAQRALGQTYEGYKGGSYTMDGETECWLANYGSCGEELTTYFFKVNGQAAELQRLNAQLEKAREILEAADDYISCDWFPHKSRNGNDRAAIKARARAFLNREKDNG